MPNIRLIPLTITEIALIQFLSGGPERTVYLQTKCHQSQGRSIQRWTGEQQTRLPHGNSSSFILVAGGDEAYNCWDTLEETVEDPKKVHQVWDAFEKSFKQSSSFWHFRDTYLADFRQDPSETTVTVLFTMGSHFFSQTTIWGGVA